MADQLEVLPGLLLPLLASKAGYDAAGASAYQLGSIEYSGVGIWTQIRRLTLIINRVNEVQ
jgi:hypothetical protein